jgi:predicted ATPase
MIQVCAIEIAYFRSIHKVRLRGMSDLVVLAGRNDVGKSNILKALNLFFNNQTDWNTPFDFQRDFSRKRLVEVRKETIKGKQYVQIKIGFERGNRYDKSLPQRFTVTRTWYRDSLIPATRSSLQRQFAEGNVPAKSLDRALASLQRYLNTVRFEYVPAIKDQQFFTYMLGLLQDRILGIREGESEVGDAVHQLNDTVTREAEALHAEFNRVTGVQADIRLPEQLSGLFRAFAVATKSGEEDMPLNLRGDGIRSRFLPSLLHFISERSNLSYIWGFEEPENSLEYAFATKLALNMADSYSQQAQIILTSHSPAFFGLKKDNSVVFRVFQQDGSTNVHTVRTGTVEPGHHGPELLQEELGLMEFQENWQHEYEARLVEVDNLKKEVEATLTAINRERSPVLLTEGKWDVAILTDAWKRLYPSKSCPFRIMTCDTLPNDPAQGSGGVSTLRACLETVRPDEPITVGLFDHDTEGCKKGFQGLNANFAVSPTDDEVSLQRAGTAGAILLPVVAGREKYAEVLNLLIEFYFDDRHLNQKVNGRGLVLYQPEVEQTLVGTGQKLGRVVASELHLRRIDPDSKKAFVENVLPTFPNDAFKNFAGLLAKVQTVIGELQKLRAASK